MELQKFRKDNSMNTNISAFITIFTLLLCFDSTAKTKQKITPSQKGLAIAKKMEKANKGFVGETSSMEMILIDAYGEKITRKLDGKSKEVANDGDKSLSIFLSPADVKGTKMLTITHKKDDDDQWLYLPSLRRVKRIKSSSKSSAFMGSEFSYEDLGSQEIEKYSYKWLRDEKTKSGSSYWVLERKPKDIKNSGYSKNIMWVSKKLMNPTKIEYYDRKNELLKVSTVSNFQSYNVNGKKLWRPGKIHMKNVQTKKQSIFTWKKRKIGVKHPDRIFTKNKLK